MASDGYSSDEHYVSNVAQTSRKRKSFGRLTEVAKHFRNHSHETGESCSCKLKCFVNVNSNNREHLLTSFNQLKDRYSQDQYLCGLINVKPIRQRRPQKAEENADL